MEFKKGDRVRRIDCNNSNSDNTFNVGETGKVNSFDYDNWVNVILDKNGEFFGPSDPKCLELAKPKTLKEFLECTNLK